MTAPQAVSYFEGMFTNEPLRDYGFFTVASEIEATCYHEASHAVVDYMFGRPLASIGVAASYEQNERGELTVAYHGEVKVRGSDRIRVDFNYRRQHLILGCTAAVGPAGERRYRYEAGIPQRLLGASEGDHLSIDTIAKVLAARGRSRYAYQRLVWRYAQRLIGHQQVWDAISNVADDLCSQASYDLALDEPGEAWVYANPSEVYGVCRRHGLKRGMPRAAAWPPLDRFEAEAVNDVGSFNIAQTKNSA